MLGCIPLALISRREKGCELLGVSHGGTCGCAWVGGDAARGERRSDSGPLRVSTPHLPLCAPPISLLCSHPTPSRDPQTPGSYPKGLQLCTEHPSCEHPPQNSAVPAAPASIPRFGDTQVPAAPTALLPVGFLSSSPALVVAHIGAEPRVSPRSQLLASLGGGAPGAVWLLSASSPVLFKSLRCPAAATSW